MENPILVNDGDTIVLIAKTPVTVSDPVDEFPYVSQAYRVVADRSDGRTLALVALGRTGAVSQWEMDRYKARTDVEALRKILDDDELNFDNEDQQSPLSQMKNTLVIIKQLLENPTFVKQAVDDGFKFDALAIFNAFAKASGWKFSQDIIVDAR